MSFCLYRYTKTCHSIDYVWFILRSECLNSTRRKTMVIVGPSSQTCLTCGIRGPMEVSLFFVTIVMVLLLLLLLLLLPTITTTSSTATTTIAHLVYSNCQTISVVYKLYERKVHSEKQNPHKAACSTHASMHTTHPSITVLRFISTP